METYQSERSRTTAMAGTETSRQNWSKTYPSFRTTSSICCNAPSSTTNMFKAPRQTIQGSFISPGILVAGLSMAGVCSHPASTVEVSVLPLVFVVDDSAGGLNSERSDDGIGIDPAKSTLRMFKKRRTHRVQTCRNLQATQVMSRTLINECLFLLQISR